MRQNKSRFAALIRPLKKSSHSSRSSPPSHFGSLRLRNEQREPTTGEIFRSDLTGDGTTGDVLPGTNVGSFGRDVTTSNLNNVISNYNNNFAGKLTPAGMALVNAGLFTQQQLIALGAVAPTLASAPSGEVGPGSLFTADLRLSWVMHMSKRSSRMPETFTIEPSVAVFNVTNSQNYDFANNILSGILQAKASPSPGSANSTLYTQRTTHVGLGSGVYALGAPRVFEWGMKVTWSTLGRLFGEGL